MLEILLVTVLRECMKGVFSALCVLYSIGGGMDTQGSPRSLVCLAVRV
jgi:hypothetical protein